MNKKIVFFLVIGLLLSKLFACLTWFQYSNSDVNWMITDFSRLSRIFSLEVIIAIALFVSSRRLWGALIIVIPSLINVLQLPLASEFIGEFDPMWLDIKQVILFLGLFITTIQVLLLFKERDY